MHAKNTRDRDVIADHDVIADRDVIADPDRDVIANRDVIAELNITLNERDWEINHLREDLHSVNHNLQLVSIK